MTEKNGVFYGIEKVMLPIHLNMIQVFTRPLTHATRSPEHVNRAFVKDIHHLVTSPHSLYDLSGQSSLMTCDRIWSESILRVPKAGENDIMDQRTDNIDTVSTHICSQSYCSSLCSQCAIAVLVCVCVNGVSRVQMAQVSRSIWWNTSTFEI